MKYPTALILTLTLFSQSALAQIKTLELAVETAPMNISFPSSPDGVVTFKPCAEECDLPYVRVTLAGGTSFRLDGVPVKFEDFRKRFTQSKSSAEAYALVTYDVESKLVIEIEFAS